LGKKFFNSNKRGNCKYKTKSARKKKGEILIN